MSYNKPTLTEIYVQMFFVDGCLPANKIFDVVPLLKNIGFDQVELSGAINTPGTGELYLTPRIRCWDRDRRRLVQFSPDLMVINQTKEYLGWKTFIKFVVSSLNLLKDAGVEPRYRSVSLHTIDEFSVSLEGYTLDKWLNCDGYKLPSQLRGATQSCDIILGLGFLDNDRSNRQLNLQVRPRESQVDIRFESVFHDQLNDSDNLDNALERLHTESNESFESTITDHLRDQVMQGRS